LDILLFFALVAGGAVAFAFSTISGGGGALLLVPYTSLFVPVASVAPAVNLGNFIGRPARMVLFWKHIRFDVVAWYLPFAAVGVIAGGSLLRHVNPDWIQLGIGLFLVSTLVQFKFGRVERSFEMKRSYFAPLGFVVAAISTLAGATGAVLNAFYLNYGITKEQLVATKAFNSFAIALVQLPTYYMLDLLGDDALYAGLAIGVGAFFGNLIGKKYLAKMSQVSFLRLVVYTMGLAGIVMVVQALQSIVS
jgi:uncharacterized membrane protein YfcA